MRMFLMLVMLTGCSNATTGMSANGVDVAEAASKAQSDIANYAAGNVAAPHAVATHRSVGSTATPGAVTNRYFAAIAGRRYRDAWALWDDAGRASGMTEAAFAASFAPYADYHARIGVPSAEEAGAGQRYVTVPVVVTGSLRTGKPFRLEGPVVLHRVADGIESDDPAAHEWRVRSSGMKPRPPTADVPDQENGGNPPIRSS